MVCKTNPIRPLPKRFRSFAMAAILGLCWRCRYRDFLFLGHDHLLRSLYTRERSQFA